MLHSARRLGLARDFGRALIRKIKNPVKDFCWWDLDGVCLSVVVVVVVQW